MESHDRGHATRTRDKQFVVFILEEQRYAIPLRQVERIVRAVEVKALPEAPAFLHGVVNVQGRALPVVDLRRRFGLPERDIDPGDHFIIADGSDGSMILPVDDALGSRELLTESCDGNGEGPHHDQDDWAFDAASDAMRLAPDCVTCIVPDAEGMVFVLDLDQVMSFDAGGRSDGAGLRTVEMW